MSSAVDAQPTERDEERRHSDHNTTQSVPLGSAELYDCGIETAVAVAEGDKLRDKRRWAEAALAYRKALDLDWELAPIWVQYGHALKESGDFLSALAAYEQALELGPEVADTYLQLGHLLKIMGEKKQARDAYWRALQLDPKLHDARRELNHLGEHLVCDAEWEGACRFYYDISDLIDHFQRARSPTGIQRIVMSVVEAALAGEPQPEQVNACAIDAAGTGWKLVPPQTLLRIIGLSHQSSDEADPEWIAAVSDFLRALDDAEPFKFPNQSVVVTLGSPWGITGFIHAVDTAKRTSNVTWIAYVHDTVPLSFPEYCDSNMPSTYLRWMGTVLSFADKVLTNSESTKAELLKLLPELAGRCSVVRPNGDFCPLFDVARKPSEQIEALLHGQEYVLVVGTIEPRKNHLLATAAWRRLLVELGPEKVPVLVFAGKLGWNWESVLAFAERTAHLNGKLKIFTDIADVDLGLLYRGALFTLCCSHHEGWGLPVTEGLSFGKVPVLPKHSGLVESGGEHAVFYAANSERALVDAICGLLGDRLALKRRGENLHARPAVRSWGAISEEIIAQTKDVRPAVADSRPLALGKVYRFGLLGLAVRRSIHDRIAVAGIQEFAATEALKGVGWHAPEEWGVRTAEEFFTIQFVVPTSPISEPASANHYLYLGIRGHEEEAELHFHVNGLGAPAVRLAKLERRVARLSVPTLPPPGGLVRISCTQTGVYSDRNDRKAHQRRIGIGFEFLMLCGATDIAARFSVVEEAAGLALLGS